MTTASLEKRLARIEAMLEQLLSRQDGTAEIRPTIQQELAIGKLHGKTAIQVAEDRYRSKKRRGARA